MVTWTVLLHTSTAHTIRIPASTARLTGSFRRNSSSAWASASKLIRIGILREQTMPRQWRQSVVELLVQFLRFFPAQGSAPESRRDSTFCTEPSIHFAGSELRNRCGPIRPKQKLSRPSCHSAFRKSRSTLAIPVPTDVTLLRGAAGLQQACPP